MRGCSRRRTRTIPTDSSSSIMGWAARAGAPTGSPDRRGDRASPIHQVALGFVEMRRNQLFGLVGVARGNRGEQRTVLAVIVLDPVAGQRLVLNLAPMGVAADEIDLLVERLEQRVARR